MIRNQKELPVDIPEKELISVVAGLRPEFNRAAALKTLIERDSTQTGRVLSNLLNDTTEPSELRQIAAVVLGSDTTHEDVLLKSISKTTEPSVLRRIAQSLGRIGSPKALEALRNVRLGSGNLAAQNVKFARSLISYRYGLGQYLIPRPAQGDILQFDHQKASDLNIEPLAPADVSKVIPSLAQSLPAIAVSEKAATGFSCLGSRFWLLLNAEMVGPDAAKRVNTSNAVVAVVMKREHCPEGWQISEYLLSHPERGGQVDIVGVRPSGASVHFGQIQTGSNTANIRLEALNSPFALPLVFEAEYNTEEIALKVTRAISALQPSENQQRPSIPRRDKGLVPQS